MIAPDRVAFTLFGRDVYWYGVLMALGILVGIGLTLLEGKRKKFTEDNILDMCLVMIPSGVVGARLYYVIFEWASYAADPIRILYLWEGGLAIYGAVIGGLTGIFVYSRVKKIRFLKLADCIAPGLVLAQAIGRWGNYFNQEAFGLPINNGELIWFPFAVRIEGYHTFNGAPCSNPYHMATFFYESMWCLAVFIILWSIRRRFKHDGDAIFTYGMLYGLERMVVEAFRGDSLYLIQPGELIADGIRVSQLVSFAAAAGVLAFFLIRHAKEKKLGRLIWPSPEEAPEAEPLEAGEEAGPPDGKLEDAAQAVEDKLEQLTDGVEEKIDEPQERIEEAPEGGPGAGGEDEDGD